jgi:hypothetical protein
MAILEKEVLVCLSNNIQYFENKGYEIPRRKNKDGVINVKRGTKILVKLEDLPERSNVKVTKICDKCNKLIPNQTYNTVMSNRKINGGNDFCFNCGKYNGGRTKALDMESVKRLLLENGLTPLFNSYANVYDKLLCETQDGYKVVPLLDNVKANKIPRVFAASNPHTIDNIKHYIHLNKIRYKLTSTQFISARNHKLTWECDNGHEFIMSWDVFRKGHRCPECNESKGEKEIRTILDSYGIQYAPQYEFEDLKGIGGFCLRFDFAIFRKNELVLLIEYDGAFHFKKQYQDDHYEMLIEHDKRKNKYCINNNINLLRIPYWDFDNLKSIIEDVLVDYRLII